MMIDSSNSSNISSHEKLLQEYRRECDKEDERLLLSIYRKTEQGVIKIKEWKPPSTIDLLKEVQSSDTLSDVHSDLVQYLIDQENSSIPIPVIQKSAIEKLATNLAKLCLMLLIMMKFGRLKTNLSIQNPLERAQRLYLVFLCSGGNKAKIKKPVVTKLV